MADALTNVARFFAAGIWAVVGIFFWIPMIFRIFFLQVSLLIMSAFVNKSNKNIDGLLNRAINFYSDGFRRIFTTERGEEVDHVFSMRDLEKFIPTIVFTFGFYLSTIVFYYALKYII